MCKIKKKSLKKVLKGLWDCETIDCTFFFTSLTWSRWIEWSTSAFSMIFLLVRIWSCLSIMSLLSSSCIFILLSSSPSISTLTWLARLVLDSRGSKICNLIFFKIFSLSCVGACAYLDPGPGGDCVLTVLQPSPAHPGYLAGDELLHREPATRVLTFYTLYGKNKNGRKESPEDSGIVPICTNWYSNGLTKCYIMLSFNSKEFRIIKIVLRLEVFPLQPCDWPD